MSELHHRGQGSPEPAHAEVAGTLPPQDTAARLAAIWQEVLALESVGVNDNYFDLGGDSALTVQIFAQIEKEFKVKLPLAILFEAPTVSELASVIDQETPHSDRSSLSVIQPSGSRPPFFCVHGETGTVSIFSDLSRHLGRDYPFYGLQSQGLDGLRPPLTKIEDMAGLYVQDIRKIRPHGPYFLGGYCMGGSIAFEMARQLQAQGEVVALLALIDTMNWSRVPAPSKSEMSFYSFQRFVFRTASRFRGGSGKELNTPRASQGQSSSSDISLSEKIRIANGLACSNYIPGRYAGKVTDFRPMKQYRIYKNEEFKWGGLAEETVVTLPVYPDEMLAEPFVKHLASALKESIELAIPKPDAVEAVASAAK